MWLVYYDSTRRDEHAHLGEPSQRVANLELGHFEVWNFDQKCHFFPAKMSIFSQLGGARACFKGSNESWDLSDV